MTTLVLGANTVIDNPQCKIAFSTQSELQFGQQLGLLWLPLDDRRKAIYSPVYLHDTKNWATLDNTESPREWHLDVSTLFDKGVHHIQLIAYTYHIPNLNLPAVEIVDVSLTINQTIHYNFKSHERHIKAAIVLEIYRKNGQYKCRALGETSTQGLDSLEQHVEASLDACHPAKDDIIELAHNQSEHSPHQSPHQTTRQVQAGETWSSTAFAIDPYHLLTCYHVIDGAAMIGIRQQGEADREAKVVMSDVGSNSAILKVSEPLPAYLSLAYNYDDLLGETIIGLGFPLLGLNSQLQVTQGCVSGLTGLNNDIRYMQFTAPIQPGSSGSPLLLPNGEVIGMISSGIVHESVQNVNYAVKSQILLALLSSAGIRLNHLNTHKSATPLATPQLTRQSNNAIWLVGCQG